MVFSKRVQIAQRDKNRNETISFPTLEFFPPLGGNYLLQIIDPSRNVSCDHNIYNYIFDNYTQNYIIRFLVICFDHVLIQIEDISISIYVSLHHSFYGCVVFHAMAVSKCTFSSLLMDLEVVLGCLVGGWLVGFCYCDIAANILVH